MQSITIGSIDSAKRHLVNKADLECTTPIEGGVLQRVKIFINKSRAQRSLQLQAMTYNTQ
jgi:hypothetical protein